MTKLRSLHVRLRLTHFLYILSVFALVGCNSGDSRDFEWPPAIAELTGKDLGKWLRQVPFSNELSQTDEDHTVITNAAQVFPFMGRYHNAVGELRYLRNEPENPVYQQETVLYQDPEWGDLFVNATLLYDAQEVFLDQYFRESGNIVFGGVAAGMSSHTATLAETAVFTQTDAYKTGLYWASTSAGRYLLGFYQKDHLVFEAVIPLRNSDTVATLAKLNAVNEKLGLQIKEWQQATVRQVKPADTRTTFWEDPFMGLYMEDPYLLNRVSLKIRDTPFQRARNVVEGDHYFSYDTPKGTVELFTVVEDTRNDREAFDAEHQDLPAYETDGQHVYYEEQQTAGRVKGEAKTYFKSGQYLIIHFEYPQTDEKAKATIHGILKHVKVRKL